MKIGRTSLSTHAAVVRFGKFAAVDGVDFEVSPGEIHAIIGPNGAGKTTLMNAITGTVPLYSGSVLVGTRDVSGFSSTAIARAGIARTFQHTEIFENLTPIEHVRIAKGRRVIDSELSGLVHSLISSVSNVRARELEMSSRRIVEIARALALSPSVLLLDEPVSGLDFIERQEMQTTIERIASAGVAIVLIEHDMQVVQSLAGRVTVLDSGRVVASDTPGSLIQNPEVVEVYMGGIE